MKVYTRKGDDGTTSLFRGGRVRKDSPRPVAYGAVDEVQAAIGVARAEAPRGGDLDGMLVALERDLWVLMAELATDDERRSELAGGESLVTEAMVAHLEALIDEISGWFEMPKEFVVPGQTRLSAALDMARAVTRRAERHALAVSAPGSHVVPYLNRASDLLWTVARWQEGEHLASRQPD